jgi:predicted MFS family arabinose efflux permease
VALNSSIFNAARIVGPAVAGLLIGKLGIGWCFVLNGLSFIPVILGIFMIRPLAVKRATQRKRIMAEVGDGLRYIKGRTILLTTVLLVAVVNIFMMNFSVVTPVLARSVLNLGASGYGFLMSAMGVGSLTGAVFVAVRSRSGPGTTILRVAPFIAAALLFATGFAHTVTVAAILMMATGLANILFTTNANSTMQLNSEDQYRGRVMSVYALVFGGTSPIGNMFAGKIIERYGASVACMVLGALTVLLVGVIVLTERRQGRRVSRLDCE